MNKIIKNLLKVSLSIFFVVIAIGIINLFGGFNYCWTDNLDNQNPLISLCLAFNIGIPFGLIVFAIIFLCETIKSSKKQKTKKEVKDV